MSQKSSLHRTIEILKHLNEGKQLCVTRLAQEYEVSDRTIRRDFELIKELSLETLCLKKESVTEPTRRYY